MLKKVLISFLVVVCVLFPFYLLYNNSIKKADLVTLNQIKDELTTLQNKNKDFYNNYEEISNLYRVQKIEIQELKTSNFILKEQIENLKKETPEHIKIKTTALNLLAQIAILINNNSDFLAKIEELKILANNNSNIIESLDQLKLFNKNKINIDTIIKEFHLESNSSKLLYEKVEFKNKNINHITKNVIKIKKIKKKENINKIKDVIKTLEENIKNLSYTEALDTIKKNQLEVEFSKTVSNLENKIKFDYLINKLIYLF